MFGYESVMLIAKSMKVFILCIILGRLYGNACLLFTSRRIRNNVTEFEGNVQSSENNSTVNTSDHMEVLLIIVYAWRDCLEGSLVNRSQMLRNRCGLVSEILN